MSVNDIINYVNKTIEVPIYVDKIIENVTYVNKTIEVPFYKIIGEQGGTLYGYAYSIYNIFHLKLLLNQCHFLSLLVRLPLCCFPYIAYRSLLH